MSQSTAAGVFAFVILLSYAGVEIFRRAAKRWSLLDIPNERSSHLQPIPTCGGIVLVAINLGGWLVYGLVHHSLFSKSAWVLVVAALLVAIVSFVDDLGHVTYPVRLTTHAFAAILVIGAFGPWRAIELPVFGIVALGALGTVLATFWIVGLINAFNFMDGLDGLAAGQAAAAGIGWTILGIATQHPALTVLGGLIAATSLGFLIHNWYPATIFMGDVGATFLGFGLAVLPIIAARYDPRFIVAGVLLVWPAIFDSGFTVLRRLRHRENIFSGHREFLFHRLADTGWGHAWAVILYTGLTLLGCLLAFTWQRGNRALHSLVAVSLLALCVALWATVRHRERATPEQERIVRALRGGPCLAGQPADTPDPVVLEA